MFKPSVPSTIFLFALAALFAGLGNWQLERKAEKEKQERELKEAEEREKLAAEVAELNEIGKELGFRADEIDGIRNEFRDQLAAIQAMRRARGV